MRAIVQNGYGSLDVLELKDVEKQAPSEGQVLVKVFAASVNPLDWHVVAGFGGMSRLIEHAVLGPLRKGGNKRVGIMSVAKVTRGDLGVLKEMIEAGKVRPLIDRACPLEKAAEAVRYLETMHALGKVIIEVGGEQTKATSE